MFEMGAVETKAGVGEIEVGTGKVGVGAVEVGACTVDVGTVAIGAGAAMVDVGAVVIRGAAVLRFEGLGLGGSSSVLSLLLSSSLSPLSLLLASLLLLLLALSLLLLLALSLLLLLATSLSLLPSLPSSFDSGSLSFASDAGSAVIETWGSLSVRGRVVDIEGRGGREEAVGARAGRSGGAMVVPSSVSRFSTLAQNVRMLV